MDLEMKLAVLDEIYYIYDAFAQTLDSACAQFCTTCCTRSVTLTTLEGYKIASQLLSGETSDNFQQLKKAADQNRFQPLITTNGLAALSTAGKVFPEEENDVRWGACPLLTENDCPIYPQRPFACRCMVSKQPCQKTGYAEMDPFVLTVNTICMQYIEHLDFKGFSGNLIDMLLFLEPKDIRDAYRSGDLKNPDNRLVPNLELKGFLIPPEHRDKIRPFLHSLQDIRLSRRRLR